MTVLDDYITFDPSSTQGWCCRKPKGEANTKKRVRNRRKPTNLLLRAPVVSLRILPPELCWCLCPQACGDIYIHFVNFSVQISFGPFPHLEGAAVVWRLLPSMKLHGVAMDTCKPGIEKSQRPAPDGILGSPPLPRAVTSHEPKDLKIERLRVKLFWTNGTSRPRRA